MQRALVFLGLLVTCAFCRAGPLANTFGTGVLGVPWGATLDQVVGVYPDGDNVFSTAPGHRSYWVREGAPFLGIPREGQGVLYGLDDQDHVVIASLAFGFERRVELQSALQSLLGVPRISSESNNYRQYYWPADGGMRVELREYSEPRHAIIWLVVASPSYKPERVASPSSLKTIPP